MKKTLLILIAAIITFSSCKKDDKKCNTDTASIAGSYKITSAKYKATSASPEADGISLLFSDACERDDVATFNASGVYTIADAGTQCDPVGGDSGTWSVNGSTLNLDGQVFTIASFDCTNLVASTDGLFAVGDKMTITFTRQ